MTNTIFKIGDKVTYTNDNGCKFPGKTIIGFCDKTTWGAEVYIDSDSPWFPVKKSNLKLESIAECQG